MKKAVSIALVLVLLLGSAAPCLAAGGNTPAAPSELTVAEKASDGVVLTWTDNSTNEDYFYIYRELSSDGDDAWDMIDFTEADVETYTDTGVTAGKTYHYKISAVNFIMSGLSLDAYVSDDSNIVTVTVPLNITLPVVIKPVSPVTAPAAPDGLEAIDIQETSVILVWNDNSSDETGFKVERLLVPKDSSIPIWAEVCTTAAGITVFLDEGLTAGTDYQFRVRSYKRVLTQMIYSAYTDVLSVTTASAVTGEEYPGASSWALPEIQLAVSAGLTTPDILCDFQNNITREEFCEIAVLLYESLSGGTAAPVSPNPFTDTVNPEVLKAYNLGIVKGVSTDRFAPDLSITRQEICVMLQRALTAAYPALDVSASGAGTFADENIIAAWAIGAVRYMNMKGIMKGVGGNQIDPLGNTTREQAIVLNYRTFASMAP
ncbi:S-layer homology domain-containing protein [Papillibacter cinnamivorans]|uniref:S-layer homology domain-containing protein n=1 Tax=Papillibacter cinnamivorans DSM 12816 TaxID=1122930 RepID=A0A1W2C122_9FIRM|nr:S-layer homology domain-containing protein [Papillibacter cinnamivorans]SMC78840.1 S-layer homology domain-containing protein [Papillibacter cinnamivorans DSM 12816]